MTALNPTFNENLRTFGKYLDQPAIVRGLEKYAPGVAVAAAAGYGIYDVFRAPKEEKKETAVRDLLVLSFALGAGFLTARGLRSLHKHGHKHCDGHGHHHGHKHSISETLKGYAEKIKKGEYLKFGQIKELSKDKHLIDELIPDSHIHTPKDIFRELGYLTGLGLMPVLGGIGGGVLADRINGENVRRESKNKIKEGTFQYLANITLCNAGAGIALWVLTKLNIENRAAKLAAMAAGVVGVGIVFGGTIANFIGKNFVNPVVDKGLDKTIEDYKKHSHHIGHMFENVNAERKPEALDLALHIDDVASVGFLAGMQWIGPILPVLYSVSGYRAGIGYRNGEAGEDDAQEAAQKMTPNISHHSLPSYRALYPSQSFPRFSISGY